MIPPAPAPPPPPAAAAATTATTAGRRGRATVPPTRVARPLDRGPVVASGRLTPFGLARARLVGRAIGTVRPGPDIGPIGMIRMVRPIPHVRPIGLIRVIGPLAYGERRRAHRNGALVRARHERERTARPHSNPARV